MTKNNIKNEQYFLEMMADSLVYERYCDQEEAVTRLKTAAHYATDEDIELRDIPDLVSFLYKAGCVPGDIIRRRRLGYCKKIIDEYMIIIQEKDKDRDAYETFLEYIKYINNLEQTLSTAKRSRK